MATPYKVITVSLEQAVFDKLEKVRGNHTRFRSSFVNDALREKLGFPPVVKEK